MDYDDPIPLAGDVLKQRIFSPLAYANVRRANLVAIAASEASRYAGHYPIAWRKTDSAYQLVVVRSLLSDGRGHAPGTQTTLNFLPVLARCYPFLYDPATGPQAGRAKCLDTAIADEPNDIGSPIAFADGRPAKATVQRITLLDATAPSFIQTAAISKFLAQADLYEEWPLHFENIEGETIDVPGLWIVRQTAVDTGILAPLMRAHGIVAADVIGLHRLSLYRAGMLLAQARAALQASRRALEQQAAEDAAMPATDLAMGAAS